MILTNHTRQATLRFFDSFFLEGSKILFRVGLALFKINEKRILACSDFDSLFTTLKSMCPNADANLLMKVRMASRLAIDTRVSRCRPYLRTLLARSCL